MVLGTGVTTGKKSKKNGRKAAHRQQNPSRIVLAAKRLTQGSSFGFNGASSSGSVGHNFISTNSFGHRTNRQEMLNTTAIQVHQQNDQVEYQLNNDLIMIDERTQLARIRDDIDFPSEQEDFPIWIFTISSLEMPQQTSAMLVVSLRSFSPLRMGF
jgi:hypothetical protein